jgi:hypothetical protein
MTTQRQLVHGRVDRADHRLLHREAEVRGISLTRCVGDIIREYFALRQEMLSLIKTADAPSDAHVGLVHSLVARVEDRLVVMLSTRDEELREGQRRIEAMIDWLVQMYLAHTPEVPEERRPAAAAAARRRYGNWRSAVAKSVEKAETGSAET